MATRMGEYETGGVGTFNKMNVRHLPWGIKSI